MKTGSISNENIAVIVCNHGKGKGGHTQSAISTYKFLKRHTFANIIQLGYQKNNVFNNLDNYYFINLNSGFLSCCKTLREICNKKNITILHSFDKYSHCIARCCSLQNKTRLTHTKFGGPNTRWDPVCKTFICYSKENLDFLKKKKRFKNTFFYWLPNRVITEDESLINNRYKEISPYLDPTKIKILRIARFSEHHKSSINQTIELFEDLENKQPGTFSCFIIGTIENESIYNGIHQKHKNTKNLHFLTDEQFTTKSSDFIPLFDIIVGTGRSLMEALPFAKIIYIPNDKEKKLIKLNDKNFETFLDYNFSTRAVINTSKENKLDSNIYNNNDQLQIYYKNYFEKYCKIDTCDVCKEYKILYEKSECENFNNLIDLLINLFFWFKKNLT